MAIRSTAPTSSAFLILLALAKGPANGVEIQAQILADTAGEHVPHNTMYHTLRRLSDAGYVDYLGAEAGAKYFSLSNRGEAVLQRELKLLHVLMVTARVRLER